MVKKDAHIHIKNKHLRSGLALLEAPSWSRLHLNSPFAAIGFEINRLYFQCVVFLLWILYICYSYCIIYMLTTNLNMRDGSNKQQLHFLPDLKEEKKINNTRHFKTAQSLLPIKLNF